MSHVSEHRIYKYLDEPSTFMGLTIDEACIWGILFIGGFMNFDDVMLASILISFSFLSIWGLKKLKRSFSDFPLRAFLYWYVISTGVSKRYPRRERRIYLS